MSAVDVPYAIAWIRKAVEHGESLQTAAKRFAIRYESHVDAIMDQIGCWPSSEPELRALQAVYS